MNEDQLYDAAEREMDLYRNEITRITDQRDRCSDTADRLRALAAEILGRFQPVSQDEPHGRYAIVETAAMVEHWRKRASLPVPEELAGR